MRLAISAFVSFRSFIPQDAPVCASQCSALDAAAFAILEGCSLAINFTSWSCRIAANTGVTAIAFEAVGYHCLRAHPGIISHRRQNSCTGTPPLGYRTFKSRRLSALPFPEHSAVSALSRLMRNRHALRLGTIGKSPER